MIKEMSSGGGGNSRPGIKGVEGGRSGAVVLVGDGGDVPEGGVSSTEWSRRRGREEPEVQDTVTAVTSTGGELPGEERREREVTEKALILTCSWDEWVRSR